MSATSRSRSLPSPTINNLASVNFANASITTGKPCHGFRLPRKPTVKIPGAAGRVAGIPIGNRSGRTPLGITRTFFGCRK